MKHIEDNLHLHTVIKLVFIMTWLLEILRICPEERFLIKYHMTKHLISFKIQNMDSKTGLASMVYNFLDKKSSGGSVKRKLMPNQQLAVELRRPRNREYNTQIYQRNIMNIIAQLKLSMLI